MTVPGRVRVEPRAIRSVVEAATADAFDCTRSDVRAKVREDAGQLHLEIATPFRGAGPVHATAVQRRDEIAARCATITGARFTTVRVRITGIDDTTRRRVR